MPGSGRRARGCVQTSGRLRAVQRLDQVVRVTTGAQLVVEHALAALPGDRQRGHTRHVTRGVQTDAEREVVRQSAVERNEAVAVGTDEVDAAGGHDQGAYSDSSDQEPGDKGPRKPTPPAAGCRTVA